jgi:hypothetical protein
MQQNDRTAYNLILYASEKILPFNIAIELLIITFAKKSHKMKKIFASVVALLVMGSVSFAQDSKMKSEKKETKKETKKVDGKTETKVTETKMESKETKPVKAHKAAKKTEATETKAK